MSDLAPQPCGRTQSGWCKVHDNPWVDSHGCSVSAYRPVDLRCLSSCEIEPDLMKRCCLPVDHDGTHLFVEATTSDGNFVVVRWRGMQRVPSEIAAAIVLSL